MVQLVEVEDEHFTNRPIVEDDEDFSDTGGCSHATAAVEARN